MFIYKKYKESNHLPLSLFGYSSFSKEESFRRLSSSLEL